MQSDTKRIKLFKSMEVQMICNLKNDALKFYFMKI